MKAMLSRSDIPRFRSWLVPLAISSTIGIFALDLVLPAGVAAGVLYVAVVLLTLGLPGRRATLIAALVGTLLNLLDLAFSPAGAVLWMALANRLLAVLAIWLVTAFCLQCRKVHEQLMEAERVRVLAETAGAAAHEINQHLTIITGMVDLLLSETAPDDPQRYTFEDLQEAAEEINQTVRKMGNVRHYATKLYYGNTHIVDFDQTGDEEN